MFITQSTLSAYYVPTTMVKTSDVLLILVRIDSSGQTVALRLFTYGISRLPSSSPQLAHSSLPDAAVSSSSTSYSQRT